MPDYDALVSNLENAERHVKQAEEALTPIVKIKQIDSYLLGLLRSMHLILQEAKKVTGAASRVRRPRLKI